MTVKRVLTAALALSGALAWAGPAGDGDGAATLARMRARQSSVETLAASIAQQKTFPQLGIEDPMERGSLYVERGRDGAAKLRLEIETPETRVLIAKDHTYLLYQPRIKQAVEGSYEPGASGDKAAFTNLLTGSGGAVDALERDYRTEEVAPGHLLFTAREGAKVHCRTIELWLDEATGLPDKQACREANESVITITLDRVHINEPLPEGIFELEIPGDVERVKG